jgi:hypothetical protein
MNMASSAQTSERPARSELHLVRAQRLGAGPEETIDPEVAILEPGAAAEGGRHRRERPDLERLMEWLGGEVGFREDIEGVAALLGGGEARDVGLEVGEGLHTVQ